MYVRLAFAVAVHVDPDLLLVDEVLAVGDEPFQRKCMDQIRTFQDEGRTIVLVSHSADQVGDLCDRAVLLSMGPWCSTAPRSWNADPRMTSKPPARPSARRRRERRVSLAKVKAVRLLTPDDAPVTEVAAGDEVRVQVDVEATSRQDDWILGIGIDTASGQNVYGTNTQMLDVRLPPLIGRSTYEFRLRHLNPGPGDYTVHSAVARWSGPQIHHLPHAATFSVRGDGRTVGLLGAQATLVADSTLARTPGARGSPWSRGDRGLPLLPGPGPLDQG